MMNNALNSKTYADIERLTVDLLKKTGLYYIPFDVHRLTRELGLELYSADFKNPSMSGLIRKEKIGLTSCEETAIYYNRALNLDCVRFVVAHEVGHWYLGHLEQNPSGFYDYQLDLYRRQCGVDSKYRMEVEANCFAAAILMPREFVVSSWKESSGSIEAMARRFQVSTVEMGFRADYGDRN